MSKLQEIADCLTSVENALWFASYGDGLSPSDIAAQLNNLTKAIGILAGLHLQSETRPGWSGPHHIDKWVVPESGDEE